LIIVGAVLAFVLIWLLLPPLLYRSVAGTDEGRLKAITDTRTALLAGLVGIGALGTFWLNARTQRFAAQTLRISEANFRLAERSQKETFELAERGHLTDRYANG
jgi:predicted MFS family arabinose efflux permease